MSAATPQLPFPATPRPPALLGRAAELDRLAECLRRAAVGERVLITMSGEPGVGKTRLAREFVERAHHAGSNVLAGRSYREALVPYQPFVEALERYVGDRDDATLAAEVSDTGAELARLAPSLRRRLPDLAAPPRDSDGGREPMFAAVSQLTARLAARAPAVLWLEDLQWAHAPTLAMLKHLLDHPDAGLLVLATVRGPDIAELQVPLANGEHLELAGLDTADVAGVIERIVGAQAPVDFVAAVHALTEGNPFFVEELARQLLDQGRIDPVAGRWEPPSDSAVPSGIEQVIAERLERLTADAHRLLAIAAVVGRVFDLAVVEEVGDVRGEALRRALGEATAARIVTTTGGSHSFSHALFRETIYAGLRERRRERLHGRVAAAIESRYGDSLTGQAATLAHHYLRTAPDVGLERGLAYAVAAGDHALEQLAHEEAAGHYAQALTALDRSPRSDPARRAELLLRLGQARWAVGEYAAARRDVHEAADLARRTRAWELQAAAAVEYGGREASFRTGAVDNELIDLLESALAHLPSDRLALRAEVQARLAAALAFTPQRDRGAALAAEAIELARTSQDGRALASVLNAAVWATWSPDGLDERIKMIGEFMQLAREHGDERLLGQGQHWSAAALFETGRADLARAEIEAHARSARQLRQGYRTWVAAYHRANNALLDGRISEAEGLALEALRVGQEAQNENAAQVAGVQLIFIRREQLRLGELLEGIRTFAAGLPGAPVWRCGVAWALAESGDEAHAAAELARLVADGLDRIPRDAFWVLCLWVLGELLGTLRDETVAEAVYDLLTPYADRCVVVGSSGLCCGSAERTLGILADVLGRPADAAGHFERAMAVNDRIGARVWVADTAAEYAHALRDSDPARAADLLRIAADAGSALGSARLVARAAALERD